MNHPIVDIQQALNKAQKYCYVQDRCIYDIRKKLTQWLVDPSIHNEVIESLIEDKFIDENRYLRSYVLGKFRNNKWGKNKLRFELKHKGFNGNIIETALLEINEEKYQEVINTLILKKRKSIKDTDEYQIRIKLYRFASSKGFESQHINIAIEELNIENI